MAKIDVKVVMLGKEFSGKTSVVERFLNERFAGENRYQATIGAAYGARKVSVDGKEIILGVWDTAGSERYESMTRMYYRGARAAVVCYAVNDLESWDRLEFWVTELRKLEEDCKIYICATKTDLLQGNNKKRAVDYHTTTDYCEEIGAKLFETSSKDGTNVQEVFATIAQDYLSDLKENDSLAFNAIKLDEENKKRSCCSK